MPADHPGPEDVALSLTLAVVSSSPGPLLLLDGQLVVIAASLSFCEAFDCRATDLAGQALYSVANGEWGDPELRALLTEVAGGGAAYGPIEVDFNRPGQPTRRLIFQAARLAYLDLDHTRILVAVSDVTQARADAALQQDALRRNSVLLQEVRHRVANSLQIIASVLIQNSRKAVSEETRGHLMDAHQRIMSVAALERVLSTSSDGDVEVEAYFTSLCDNITTSMIGAHEHISLTVEGGQGVVAARVCMSLGLIVTELVINAIKYAFPDGRAGRITIDYNFHGPNWVLCVRDDGVGMPPAGESVRTGLGTSIIRALAKQLNASIEVVAEHPGTKITLHHAQIALAEDLPETAAAAQAPAKPEPSSVSL